MALTALLWVPATIWGALRTSERTKLFMFHMALAETAVLGAFMAQDLALFVVFFDLMLVPFYFLIGGWGEGDRVRATTKFTIYTLVGSLLMLAGAIALGVLSADGGDVSFSFAVLEERTLGEGTQQWIFLLFAAAFLVKAPLFPLHGWVVDTYRATPVPVLVVLSAVLSKVGVYGFLRIVLPILPDASLHFQDLMLVLAVFSILYGSALAFSQDEPRLVVAYSSIAQLGFIVLGIFALDDKGAQGALMQMVNHGLVVAPLFFIIALLTARAGGSPSLAQMGGMALRAPVLAAFFLIVTLATLAMPGSPNFIGELLILFGAFEDKLAFGVVASLGVVLASVYMIRVFQRSMHYRNADGAEPPEMDRLGFVAIVPVTLVVVALGVYPQLILDRTDDQVPRPAVSHPESDDRALLIRRRSGAGDRLSGPLPAVRHHRRHRCGPDGRPYPRSLRAAPPGPAARRRLAAHGDGPLDRELGDGRLGSDHRGRAGHRLVGAVHVDAVLRRRSRHGAALTARRRGRARPGAASTWGCCWVRSPAW